MRTYDVTHAQLAEQHTAVVRGQVPHDGIAGFLGGAFSEVMRVLAQEGTRPSGPPFARYRLSEQGFDVEAGFPVGGPVPEAGRVRSATLPGGRVARVVHQGPYDEVAGAYQAAVRWIDESGLRQSGDPWEVYLDDPEVPAPRTEVFVPCTEAHR